MTARGFFRRFFAALLSLLMPGLGQTFNRQPRKAVFFLLLIPAYAFLAGAVRLAWTFHGMLLGGILQFILLACAVVDSTVCGGNKMILKRPGFSAARVWFSLAILVIALNGLAESTDFYLNQARAGMEGRLNGGGSMEPTLNPGDRLMADSRAYDHRQPLRGDVVLFQLSGQDSTDYLKRIVAVGGDIIQGKKDGVYLNGHRLEEPYITPETQEYMDSSGEINVYGPIKVPQSEFFMLGDNRQNSYDSRYYGAIPESKIRGKALYIYFSHDWGHVGKTIQ